MKYPITTISALVVSITLASLFGFAFLTTETPAQRSMRILGIVKPLADVEIATLKIYVVDEITDNPIYNVVVDIDVVCIGEPQGDIDFTATTDRNGYAECVVATIGAKVYFILTHRDYETLEAGPYELSGFPGEHDYTYHFAMAPKSGENGGNGGIETYTLKVFVIDPSKKRIYGVLVSVDGETHRTDEDGKAIFYDMLPGQYSLHVKGKYYQNIWNTVSFEWDYLIEINKDTTITVWAYDGHLDYTPPPIEPIDPGSFIL
ncbi:MAG: carboxypeptidase-like regulatory domain-containing protein, partial [Candidatus Asgardarchaeia archaeon]